MAALQKAVRRPQKTDVEGTLRDMLGQTANFQVRADNLTAGLTLMLIKITDLSIYLNASYRIVLQSCECH